MGKEMIFKPSDRDVNSMSGKELIAEHDLITKALSRPHVDGWYGFSDYLDGQIHNRLRQIRDKMADMFIEGKR